MKVAYGRPHYKPQSTSDMRVGDIAVIKEASFRGVLLLKTGVNYVSLTNPNHTWSGMDPEFEVEILPPTSVVKLEVE